MGEYCAQETHRKLFLLGGKVISGGHLIRLRKLRNIVIKADVVPAAWVINATVGSATSGSCGKQRGERRRIHVATIGCSTGCGEREAPANKDKGPGVMDSAHWISCLTVRKIGAGVVSFSYRIINLLQLITRLSPYLLSCLHVVNW